MEGNCIKCNKSYDDHCEDDKCPRDGYFDYNGTCGEYLIEEEE